MEVLSQYVARYFCSFILIILLSQVALCVEDDTSHYQKSQSIDNSSDPLIKGGNGTKRVEVESITKHLVSTDVFSVNYSKPTTSQPTVLHDNIPNNIGLPEHSIELSTSLKPPLAENSSTISSVNISSSTTSKSNSTTSNSQSTAVSPTTPLHRKSKPEETHVDEITQDSGPTIDYVVPLVVAMLAVPLVGVLCALLYIKGRDFWERRHYGRIDILWDSRSESRMDFLIDGMYRE